MSTNPGDYSISAVPHPVGDDLRHEAAEFWLSNGAIANGDEAQRRVDELVCIARNPAHAIVGVNTAYVSGMPGEADRYWFYRMFLRPQDRHLHLATRMVRAAVDTLRARPRTDPAIRGVLLVTENKKLMRASGRRLLTNLGWHQTGSERRGLDVWRIEFD